MAKQFLGNTIQVAPHGECNIVHEHGQEWAVCDTCGAQWSLNGSELEQVTEGDGFCETLEVPELPADFFATATLTRPGEDLIPPAEPRARRGTNGQETE